MPETGATECGARTIEPSGIPSCRRRLIRATGRDLSPPEIAAKGPPSRAAPLVPSVFSSQPDMPATEDVQAHEHDPDREQQLDPETRREGEQEHKGDGVAR